MIKYFLFLLLPCFSMISQVKAQASKSTDDAVSLDDLSFFKDPSANWSIVGSAMANISKDKHLASSPGKGVLINLPNEQTKGNLFSLGEYGDMDLELEFMMARKSNSGIYLQGRYEIQLLDSWGKQNPYYNDCGGIYERWDDSKPEGKKGYQGHAPRANTCRAPGLWQKMRISFQAPRFDAQGRKIANARILEVWLNETLIQEDVELTGPTRGPAFQEEAPRGPLMIQGDHGPVAFRNIRLLDYSKPPIKLEDIQYEVYYGPYDKIPDFSKLTPDLTGTTEEFTWEVARRKNEYAIRYKGHINIETSGSYFFKLSGNENTSLTLQDSLLIPEGWNERSRSMQLPKGKVPFVITYAKREGWMQPRLGLFIQGPGFRLAPTHIASSFLLNRPVNPILIDADQDVKLIRCFVDFKGYDRSLKNRIVHAISAGHEEKLHYTYDLDEGNLLQIWRGDFLDATPMWNERGDGSSRPRGSLLELDAAPDLWQLTAPEVSWCDSLDQEAAYRFKGYRLDEEGYPTFQYQAYGLKVFDKLYPEEEGKKLTREIKLEGSTEGQLHFRLAAGSKIQAHENGWYSIDDQRYYIHLHANQSASIRSVDDQQELLVRLAETSEFSYSIVF
ncbi:MAG: DUF1080 domain-containing protein [Bacteroidota bacterium]